MICMYIKCECEGQIQDNLIEKKIIHIINESMFTVYILLHIKLNDLVGNGILHNHRLMF